MRSDIEVGAVFPDYRLSDHTGKQLKLSEIQGTNPLVLHLARGGMTRRSTDSCDTSPTPIRSSRLPTPAWS